MRLEEKSAGIAVVLSVLITGLGQMYVGKILRGICVLLGSVVIGSLAVLIFFVPIESFSLSGFVAGLIIYSAIGITYWAWNIYDAYKLANQYNDYVMKNGKRPW
jgi:TM2 domain-containing membrane protein YozV